MRDQIKTAIQEKLADALDAAFPVLTRREAVLPTIPGKIHAVTGMRRAGKTCYLFQCLRDAQTAGVPKERLVYFNLEDERLATLSADDLGVIIESYYQRFPNCAASTKSISVLMKSNLFPAGNDSSAACWTAKKSAST